MNDVAADDGKFEIVLHDDPTTPFAFVVEVVKDVLAAPGPDAEIIAHRVSRAGRWPLGPFPEPVARAMLDAVERRAAAAGHPLVAELRDLARPEGAGVPACAFCDRSGTAVDKLFAGPGVHICDQCVLRAAGELRSLVGSTRMQDVHQLLDWHFGDVSPDRLVKTSRSYPGRVRADLQTAVDELFAANAIRSIGVKQRYQHEAIDLMSLWARGREAQGIAALSYEEIDVGEAAPRRCQLNGLWLLREEETPYAVVLSRQGNYQGGFEITVEVGGPAGEGVATITRRLFDAIEARIREARTYRGKVLSLEWTPHYGGSATGITVHRMAAVARDEVILPERTLAELDRTVIGFCAQRERLRALGLGTRRGVLFHGAPGTGKTHTIRYLASQLPGHTTFLITAEQIGLLPEYFALARLLQPAILVVEDADLLAKAREHMHDVSEQVLLNQLLNEMDGLKEDADILFVLSTNKPEVLEAALVARPGRVDQLIEFPIPDAECRSRLMDLYAGSLAMAEAQRADLVERTAGVSASFIKELMRRLAQYALERGDDATVAGGDAEQALEEMLFASDALSRAVLGASSD